MGFPLSLYWDLLSVFYFVISTMQQLLFSLISLLLTASCVPLVQSECKSPPPAANFKLESSKQKEGVTLKKTASAPILISEPSLTLVASQQQEAPQETVLPSTAAGNWHPQGNISMPQVS